MTKNFFRAFERSGVDYLLISGQACVVYGAARFSEDIDIWIRPSASNVRRTVGALARLDARVYKLTPPLTVRNLRRGHGFHFTFLDENGQEAYLDLLGQPPRVGSFSTARRRSRIIRTPWGAVPVVSIPDLVKIKTTQRLADYETISNLVLIAVSRSASPPPSLIRWALGSTFRSKDLAWLLARYGKRVGKQPARAALRVLLRSGSLDKVETELHMEMVRLQALDRSYWAGIIDELRTMRRTRGLLKEGTPVADLGYRRT